MREIKFRAWDKNIEAMVDPENLLLDGSGLVTIYYQNCDEVESVWETDQLVLGNIELLQYTGLKDENGVEIYEGDILKNEKDVVGRVAWNKGAGCWGSVIHTTVNRDLAESLKPFAWNRFVEVIGNIYENPELMK